MDRAPRSSRRRFTLAAAAAALFPALARAQTLPTTTTVQGCEIGFVNGLLQISPDCPLVTPAIPALGDTPVTVSPPSSLTTAVDAAQASTDTTAPQTITNPDGTTTTTTGNPVHDERVAQLQAKRDKKDTKNQRQDDKRTRKKDRRQTKKQNHRLNKQQKKLLMVTCDDLQYQRCANMFFKLGLDKQVKTKVPAPDGSNYCVTKAIDPPADPNGLLDADGVCRSILDALPGI
jgi:hypothetical protein